MCTFSCEWVLFLKVLHVVKFDFYEKYIFLNYIEIIIFFNFLMFCMCMCILFIISLFVHIFLYFVRYSHIFDIVWQVFDVNLSASLCFSYVFIWYLLMICTRLWVIFRKNAEFSFNFYRNFLRMNKITVAWIRHLVIVFIIFLKAWYVLI